MSSFVNLSWTRKGTRSAQRKYRPGLSGNFRWKYRQGRRIRRLLPYTEHRRYEPTAVFLGRARGLYRMRVRAIRERRIAWENAKPEACKRGDHNFNDEDFCTDCGTSVWHWAFMEMP